MNARTEPVAYLWWASGVTCWLYGVGYAAVGFGFLFVGASWRLLVRRTLPWQPSPLDLPLAVFGTLLLTSAAVSSERRLALGVTLMLIISGAVYFGSFTELLSRTPAARITLLRAWALGSVVAAVVGLAYSAATYFQTGSHTLAHARAEIPWGVGPNGLGTTELLGSILALGLAFRGRGWERAGWAGCGLVSLVGLLATGSRASLAGWVVAAAYLVYREMRGRPQWMAAILAGGLAVLVLASAATPQFMGRVPDTVKDVSGNRIRIWHTSLGMIAVYPLLGTGFGTFGREYERRRDPGMSPEPFAFNLALNMAVETGLLGLLAALWVAAAAVRIWRSRPPGVVSQADPFRPLIAALWAGLLVDQFADNTLFSISTSAGLWLLLALLVVPPVPPRSDHSDA